MILNSKTIYLRLATQNDAAYITELRNDSQLNKYITQNDNNEQQQREWIDAYKKREIKEQEYYFIIVKKDNDLPIGTVRVYDFLENKESFCYGSWILDQNKTRYAALESFFCVFDFAFEDLKFKRCHVHFKKENKKVIDFHLKLGMKTVSIDDEFVYGHIYPDDYYENKKQVLSNVKFS